MFEVIKKDISIFLRDKRSILLVILTPIIIMIILGNVFKGTSKEDYLKNILLVVCSEDTRFNLPEYFKTLKIEDCGDNATSLILKGNARGAIIIKENITEDIINGYGSRLILHLDNAKPQTAFALSTALEAFVNKLNENVSTTFIREAWTNLRELNTKIRFVAINLEGSKESAELVKKKITNTSKVIDIINITMGYEYLDKLNNTITEISSIINITQEINAITQNLTTRINNSTYVIISQLNSLDTIILNSSNLLEQLYSNNCNVSTFICNELNHTLIAIKKTSDEFLERNLIIKDNIGRIENATGELIKLYNFSKGVTNLMNQSISTEVNIRFLYSQLDAIANLKEDISQQIKELEDIVTGFSDEIIKLQEELNRTTILLDTYTSRKPENIVRAITMDNEEVFKGRNNLFFISSGIIMIVLMLITFLMSSSNIVSEKTSPTMIRNIMSPMPLVYFLLQKLLFFIILCFIQITLMLIVLLFFDVSLPLSLEFFIAILIAGITFGCLGILVGAMTKNENTTLLTTLVFAIPMIFMSGVFFQFENMPRVMNILGSYLPLSLTIKEVENVVIYQTGLDMFVGILILFSLLIFFLSLLLIRKSGLNH